MASGPETPDLACLMFSIPKRLPTPAPTWEPGAVGRRGRKAALSAGRARDWAGLRGGDKIGKEMLRAGKKGARAAAAPSRNRSGYSWSPQAQEVGGGRGCVTSQGTGSGTGPARWEVARGPRAKSEAGRSRLGEKRSGHLLPESGASPRAPVQGPRRRQLFFPRLRAWPF